MASAPSSLKPMTFTEKEKKLAKQLKEAGLAWSPEEGDWFWCTEDLSHQFYLGESLPSSFVFKAGEPYVFEAAMTWHIQQGGLRIDKLVWLPTWEQSRQILKKHGFAIQLHDHDHRTEIEARAANEKLTAEGETDLESLYPILLEILKTR